MDLSKHFGEAEAYGTSTSRDERNYKKAGFEHRIDRLNESIKNAKTEKAAERFKHLKDSSIKTYNKYAH